LLSCEHYAKPSTDEACGNCDAAAATAATAQTFEPAAIEFKGADDFTNQELMDAAGLKLGMALSSDDVNAHAKQLMSSGMFESLGFRTDGDTLIIELVEVTSFTR